MLYKAALRNLNLAKEGIIENSPQKRGEHIGKVIAIITELYSSLDPEIDDDSIHFLRELYSKMLTELPKVSLDNNVKIIDLTYSYIKQLNHIWETQVLKSKHKKLDTSNKKNSHSAYNGLIGKENTLTPRSLFA